MDRGRSRQTQREGEQIDPHGDEEAAMLRLRTKNQEPNIKNKNNCTSKKPAEER